MSAPMKIQTSAGHLIGLVTMGVISVASWEFGAWVFRAPAEAKDEVPTVISRSTDRDTVAQFSARIDGKSQKCYVQILHAARKWNLMCLEANHARM